MRVNRWNHHARKRLLAVFGWHTESKPLLLMLLMTRLLIRPQLNASTSLRQKSL